MIEPPSSRPRTPGGLVVAAVAAWLASGALVAALLVGELFGTAETGTPRRLLGFYPLALGAASWLLGGGAAGALSLLRRARGGAAGVARTLPWIGTFTVLTVVGVQLWRHLLRGGAVAIQAALPVALLVLGWVGARWLEKRFVGRLEVARARRGGAPAPMRRLALALTLATVFGLLPAVLLVLLQPREQDPGSLARFESRAGTVADGSSADHSLVDGSLAGGGSLAPAESPPSRLLILGIDGARWEILDPLLAAGRMPRLASLVERGRRGILRNPDLRARTSPVAWTSLFTGQPPEVHGVTGWDRAGSGLRRGAALWEILDGLGWSTLTLNVPATFPAEALSRGAVVAGEPMLDLRHGTSAGWWLTTRRDTPRDVARTLVLDPEAIGDRPWEVRLINDYGIAQSAYETTPGILLRAAGLWHRRPVQAAVRRLAPASLRLHLALVEGEEAGRFALAVGAAGTDPVAVVPEGSWSPWLEARIDGELARFRLLPTALAPGTAKIAVSPLHRAQVPGLVSPERLARRLDEGGEPYRVGPDVNTVAAGDLDLAEALVDSLGDLARDRARAARRLHERIGGPEKDARIVVFTEPDRAQHVFWPFRQPELYEEEARPQAEAVRRLGDAIDAVYEAVDQAIGDLLAETPAETLIVVVSDHGAQGGEGLPYDHHEEGMYLLVDPREPSPAPVVGPELGQEDLLPLLFARLGLPAAEDWPGRVPEGLRRRDPTGVPIDLPAPVSAYERVGAGTAEPLDEEALERLRSLGYLDG